MSMRRPPRARSGTWHNECGQNWARFANLIGTCIMNGVESYACLRDLFTRLTNGHLARNIDAPMPWGICPNGKARRDSLVKWSFVSYEPASARRPAPQSKRISNGAQTPHTLKRALGSANGPSRISARYPPISLIRPDDATSPRNSNTRRSTQWDRTSRAKNHSVRLSRKESGASRMSL
ncbi:transposase domain-containing protein [Sinirhodobacter populi]|uniref:Transposase domain-containing protein n=1 Tax=Paenirhodobacter populi TaxID=2306993 RepID=A0A443JWW5_9RHOB|nr:transposase domain-containing protein [Sinirhodobacter populi]